MQHKKTFIVKGTFVVRNEKGLHTRPSTELVKCSSSFNSKIQLFYRNYSVNAKSLLGILMLAARRGAKIKIEATGEDAKNAINAILTLASKKFNIRY
ncbi:MAG: Phosphocarrier protein HPr [Candidatus Anoxychlamydiales bacterium]|nr:Phosphocarrier protein HPr [Candidatus Anoxychlamydiales bacterium]